MKLAEIVDASRRAAAANSRLEKIEYLAAWESRPTEGALTVDCRANLSRRQPDVEAAPRGTGIP